MRNYLVGLRKNEGFTLVELMVSLFLSSIVLMAGFGLFVSSNRAFQATGEVSMAQQTARAALDVMTSEIEMAGFGTLSPKEVHDLATIDLKEQNVVFTSGSVNKYASGTADRLQFRGSIGGMVILAKEINYTVFINGGPALLHPKQKKDRFVGGELVSIMGPDRKVYGSAAIGSITDTHVAIVNFVVDPNSSGIARFPIGTVIVSLPLVYTYQLSEGKLLRCVRLTADAECVADESLDKPAVPGDPVTTYVLAHNVEDLQFSYYLTQDPVNTANGYGWQPDLSSAAPVIDFSAFADRERIRAVKIEILVKSDNYSPMISQEDCGKDNIKKMYYLGDNAVDVSATDACRYNLVQLGSIVKVPNAIIDFGA